MSETSGNFKRLLVSLCAGGRDESGVVDHDAATRDATELLRAGELRVGTDESTFNMVFCQRNFAQIKLVSFTQYFYIGKCNILSFDKTRKTLVLTKFVRFSMHQHGKKHVYDTCIKIIYLIFRM